MQHFRGLNRFIPTGLTREETSEVATGTCPGTDGSRRSFTYILLDAELQTPVLDHVDAVIFIPRPEQALALLQLDEDHVAAKLQEEGLLEVAQDPAAKLRASGGLDPGGSPEPVT